MAALTQFLDRFGGNAALEDEDARARNDAEEAARHEQFMEALAQEKNDFLDRLPNDMGHAVSALNTYDFMSPSAKQMFDELMQELRDQVNQQMAQQMGQQMQQGGAESTAQQMKNMLEELTQMLQQRMQGMNTQEQWDEQAAQAAVAEAAPEAPAAAETQEAGGGDA